MTISDPLGRETSIRTDPVEIENSIPDLTCYFIWEHYGAFGLGQIVNGPYEFRISGLVGTAYELYISQSVNSFDMSEVTFEGQITEEGQIITHQITSTTNRPMALFSAEPHPAFCNQPIVFDASESYHLSPERSIISYQWDWENDGLYDDSGMSISHSYPASGSYTVTLRVVDDNDPPQSMSLQMAVTALKAFEANFGSLSTVGYVPFKVNFQDLSTGAETWSWDFNNDGLEDSREQNPSFLYESPGTYTIRLGITGEGQTDTKIIEDYIMVKDCPKILYVNRPF